MDQKAKDTSKKSAQAAANDAQQELNIIEKAKANKKVITWSLIVVIAVVAAILIFMMVSRSNAHKADIAIGEADDVALNDSTALEMYRNVATMGHDAGNRAKIEAAIILYRKANYNEALEMLKDASVSEPVVKTGVYTLMGDCYVNLLEYDKALSAFKDALDEADGNPELTPFILIKMAHVYRVQNNFEKEAEAYQTIIDDYPGFSDRTYMDYAKYVERAKNSTPKQAAEDEAAAVATQAEAEN